MNLIYQFWTGKVPLYARESSKAIKAYADLIGAEYRFDENPKPLPIPNAEYLNCFRAILDESFHKYDNVLFMDMDIFPTEGLSENIFEIPVEGIGICEELQQPELREKSDSFINGKADNQWADILKRKWNIDHPRDDKGRCRVFNSGVVMYTQEGMIEAKKYFIDFNEWTRAMSGMHRFYALDQNYLNANLFSNKIKWTIMPSDWNVQIHFMGNPNQKPRPIYDVRNKDTKFVHIQLRGRNTLTPEKIYDITNKPISEWRHR